MEDLDKQLRRIVLKLHKEEHQVSSQQALDGAVEALKQLIVEREWLVREDQIIVDFLKYNLELNVNENLLISIREELTKSLKEREK